jgi:mRNA-degrading endonuclease RelE of RelBE toxin-antitoxin system
MAPPIRRVGSRIKVHDLPKSEHSGGENLPLEYPHLYRVRAGDWRISYAVENNRLAILVLEVLTAEESVQEDIARREMAKMKVRLLDLPEDMADTPSEVEETEKKPMIKVLDLSDDQPIARSALDETGRKPRIKLLDLPTRE